MAQGTNLVVVVLKPLNGLLVANPLEGFLGRLEVGVELSDQVAQGMLQHSADKLTFISSKKSVLRSNEMDQTTIMPPLVWRCNGTTAGQGY
jgi:hypothetical protein